MFVNAVVASGPPGSAAIAAGSTQAADIAAEVIAAGGNAIDAVVAAGFATPTCEPVLSSVAGGGFINFKPADADPKLLDFFVDVPGLGGKPSVYEVNTVAVDFGGDVTQIFHTSWGTAATPGALAGLMDAHARWGLLPLADVIAPAERIARNGVSLDAMQVKLLRIVETVLNVTPDSAALYANAEREGTFRNRAFAELLRELASGLPAQVFLYELADTTFSNGGIVSRADIDAYRTVLREPLSVARNGATVWTNPPPSFGGTIIAAALQGIPRSPQISWPEVVRAMESATEAARAITDVSKGTTHISIIDREGNLAAFTVSNGSGSGAIVDGVQLNNMLGEEDLNLAIRRGGIGAIHDLEPGNRMGSMMAPTIARLEDGTELAIGTGGSERIRSALITTLIRVIDGEQTLVDAIEAPRVHVANGLVEFEPGIKNEFDCWDVREWPVFDLYFGGVHGVVRHADGSVTAVADQRRGGHVIVL